MKEKETLAFALNGMSSSFKPKYLRFFCFNFVIWSLNVMSGHAFGINLKRVMFSSDENILKNVTLRLTETAKKY